MRPSQKILRRAFYLCLGCSLITQTTTLNAQQQSYASPTAAFAAAIYRIEPAGQDSYTAWNMRQNLGMRFRKDGLLVESEGRTLSLQLTGWGRGNSAASTPAELVASGRRIEYRRPGIVEWYVNDTAGIEQGFTVAQAPTEGKKGESLALSLHVAAAWKPCLSSDGRSVFFHNGSATDLQYAGLKAWDADHRELPAHMEIDGETLRILVNDAGAPYPVTVDPTIQGVKLRAADSQAGDEMGTAVSISGDTAIAGAPRRQGNQGAVYVFVRHNETWSQQAMLTASDAQNNDQFGASVAIAGDTVAAGAPGSTASTGAVYVFKRTGTVWTQQAIVHQNNAGPSDRFGQSLSLSGNTMAVGSPGHKTQGAVMIMVEVNSSWSQQNIFYWNGNNLNGWGGTVSIDGDTVAVGAPGENANTGITYIFTRSSGLWSGEALLTASDGVSGDFFGANVSVSGDTLLSTATGSLSGQGAAYVFVRSGRTWSQQAKLSASDGASGSFFGLSGALSGDVAVIGAFGQATVGAAYVYQRSQASWQQVQILNPVDPQPFGRFGLSVAIDGLRVAIGAARVDGDAGAMYLFNLQQPTVTIQSNPPGQSFTVSGTGCAAGLFTTPQNFYDTQGWSPASTCQVAFTGFPAPINTMYTFQSWDDGPGSNPRSITVPTSNATTFYTANFTTQYNLQTASLPPGGGSVSGGGYYFAGFSPSVSAAANPGYVFTGYSGAITGTAPTQTVLMSAPESVTANFAVVGPATVSALITAKSGTANARVWTVTLSNSGASAALLSQINGLMLVQTFGTPCIPVRTGPSMFPLFVGSIASGGSAPGNIQLDFSSCPANARFNATVIFTANGGGAGGATLLANQFQ